MLITDLLFYSKDVIIHCIKHLKLNSLLLYSFHLRSVNYQPPSSVNLVVNSMGGGRYRGVKSIQGKARQLYLYSTFHTQGRLRPRSHEAETGETVTVSIYPVSKYLRKDEAKRNRVDL